MRCAWTSSLDLRLSAVGWSLNCTCTIFPHTEVPIVRTIVSRWLNPLFPWRSWIDQFDTLGGAQGLKVWWLLEVTRACEWVWRFEIAWNKIDKKLLAPYRCPLCTGDAVMSHSTKARLAISHAARTAVLLFESLTGALSSSWSLFPHYCMTFSLRTLLLLPLSCHLGGKCLH